MTVLMAAADGGEPGGGAGGAPPPASPPAPAPPPAAPHVDAEKVKIEARAEVLKALGYETEDAFEADKKARKKAAEDKMSEAEKRDAALKDALDARGKSETAAEKHKSRADALEAKLAMRDLFDAEGVKAADRRIVETLLDDARGAAKQAGKPLDEKSFFDGLRKERSYLFGGAGQQLANTSPGAPPPAANGASMLPQGLVDVSKMSDTDYRQWKRAQGLLGRRTNEDDEFLSGWHAR